MASKTTNEQRIKAAMAKIMAGQSSTPSLEALTLNLLDQFGGTNAFAKEYKKQYDACQSSMVKSKMLGEMMYLIRLTSSNKQAANLADFSTEDLQAVASEALGQLADENLEVQADASQEETEAP